MSARAYIGVVDYGRGNLRSVAKALEKVGAPVRVSASPAALASAAGLVLPGVGAFGDALAELRRRRLDVLLRRWEASGRPLLGVCLGLQLLCRDSDEFGLRPGLGLFGGLRVRRFGRRLKVPHMGWNPVVHDPGCPLFAGVPQGAPFYFLHSYRAAGRLGRVGVAAEAEYGDERFAAALWRGNVFATQFHPEKSQKAGLRVYRNFWGLCRRGPMRGRGA